jgi:hypothetical protein
MKNRRELIVEWDFPHVQRFGVTLVARKNWDACVQKIFADGCQFYGYDAFRVFDDGSIQPNGEWDRTWKENTAPKLDEVLIQLTKIQPEITHIEFVFSKAT